MRYVGGKSKVAKSIREAILSETPLRRYYLEPFVGGGGSFFKMAPNFEWSVAGDLQKDLVLMWNALIFEGWTPPEDVTEDDYRRLRNSKPSPERGFVGFGGSFGGKWFGGYARGGFNSNGTPRNHQAESARSLIKDREYVRTNLTPERLGKFRNQGYSEWSPVAGTVIYCDPPYADTLGYEGAGTGFDSDTFWNTADSWVNLGCRVFVSEYSAPEHWDEIWSTPHRQSASLTGSRFLTTERLFTRKEA